MRKILLLVAGIAVLTVACRAEVNIGLDVEEDGSGQFTVEVGADEEFAQLMELAGQDPSDVLGAMDLELAGAETYQRTEGDLTIWGASIEFEDVGDLDDMADISAADSPFGAFAFDLGEDTAQFRATLDVPAGPLDDVPLDIGQITGDVFSFGFVVGMPGTVVEHDAHEVLADGSLRWEIPITGGEVTMTAQSALNGGGTLWWLWIVLVAVVLFGILIAILAIIIQRRESRRAVESAAAEYPQQIPIPPQQHVEGVSAPETAAEADTAPADEAEDDV